VKKKQPCRRAFFKKNIHPAQLVVWVAGGLGFKSGDTLYLVIQSDLFGMVE